MRTRIPAVILTSEAGEFGEEIARIFRELGLTGGGDALAGECSPAIDVYETDEALEILMDLPGVDPSAIRVVAKGATMLIGGQKAPRRGRGDSSFHLVERGFGRFARAVRLAAPCDPRRARATLVAGELRISVPKVSERRGTAIVVSIAAGRPQA